MKQKNELQIGKAGEYLVCADLITKGLIAFPSEQGLSYDVVLDNGKRLLRIQVKTTLQPRTIPQRNKETLCYMFGVKRKGKNNSKRYTDEEIDVFALVALDSRIIAYFKNKDLKTSMNFRVDSLKGTYYDEKGVSDHQVVHQLRREGKTIKEISDTMGLNLTTVYRMKDESYLPYKSEARYLSDFERTADWFYAL